MSQFKVKFQPEGLDLMVTEGKTLMEAINEARLDIDFPCGGKGKCGKCRVRVMGEADKPTTLEEDHLETAELAAGTRLACVTKVNHDMVVELTFNKNLKHQILQSTELRQTNIDPHITKTFVEVESPSLDDDSKPDWQRIKDALQKQGMDIERLSIHLSVLRTVPETLRQAKHQITVVTKNNQVLGIEAGNTTKTLLGMAFDIGTTTIVGYLTDLISGKELAVVSTLNPQTKYGADVISRNTFASQGDGLEKLHAVVVEAINNLIAQGSEQAGVKKEDVYAVTIAGNTSMHHLFIGITPKYLASSPFVTAVKEPLEIAASELNVAINRGGQVLVLPNIAGFVGADTVAVLVATEMEKCDDIKLMIDIGTNGEIVLGSKGKMNSCSAAAGPAFEGAQISSGMRGANGAIDHVYFRDKVEYSMIGSGKPKGICGSALLDIIAGLLELGIINEKGKLLTPDKFTNPDASKFATNLVKHEDEDAFVILDGSLTEHGRPILITQSDVRQLQLAKGAMVAGIKILFDKCGIQPEEVKEVLLAGAFGNYMHPHSACVIGLIPRELEDRIKLIGNAAGLGSKIALLSASEYRRSADIANFVGHVELASYPKFSSIFAKATYFKA